MEIPRMTPMEVAVRMWKARFYTVETFKLEPTLLQVRKLFRCFLSSVKDLRPLAVRPSKLNIGEAEITVFTDKEDEGPVWDVGFRI